jgi:DNA processing protein
MTAAHIGEAHRDGESPGTTAELRVAAAAAEAGVDAGRLARRAGGWERLLAASPRELAALGALPALVDALVRVRRLDVAVYCRRLERAGVTAIPASDARYPARLRDLPDPPGVVFLRGAAAHALVRDGPVLAIVGSRCAAAASLALARDLASQAAAAGAVIVSGLALGVDAAAHEGALDAGAATVAVLGCGIDVVYPRANRRLHGRVERAGLLVSEYPPGTPAARWRFPARNRLIAALADAVLVVEARERSGALITADHALDLGRDVLAVPGSPAAAGAAGTNGLLKAGAGLIEDGDDLLAWLGLDARPAADASLPPAARAVLAALAEAPAYPDELASRLDRPVADVQAALAELELAAALSRDAAGRLVPVRRPRDAVP